MLSLTSETLLRSGQREPSSRASQWMLAAVIAGTLLMPGHLKAQSPTGIAGPIEGNDITVEHPAVVMPGTAAGVWVGNGSIVIVHSGQARLSLGDGGVIEICGPAKFTFLETGGKITLALEFGRVRLELPTEIPLQIYTPFVTATPVAIGEGSRDFTLGLDLNGALCVSAAQGAIRLQQQFTGEDLIVPQTGEFFISGGLLAPATGAPGSCRCDVTLSRANPLRAAPAPSTGLVAPPVIVSTAPSNPPGQKSAAPPADSYPIESPMRGAVADGKKTGPLATQEEPNKVVEFSVPASVNPSPSVVPRAKNNDDPNPPVDAPIWKVMMPPLTFSADSPYPPPDPSPETILLVRESRVQPEWVFNGQVEAVAAPAKEQPQPVLIAEKNPAKKPGFWAKLKRFLSGEPAGCEGTGCAD